MTRQYGSRLGAVLLLTGLLAFGVWPALRAPFTADDFVLLRVSTAPGVAESLRFFGSDWGGSRGHGGYYRPLINVSLAADHRLHGFDASGFRRTNLVLHLGCSLVTFLICRRRLSFSIPEAWACSLLFALHPFHDQAILWVAGRTDVLCGVFYLLALFWSLSNERAVRALGPPAFLAALLSKEMAVSFPLVLFAWHATHGEGPRLTRAVRRTLPHVIAVVLYLLARRSALGPSTVDPAFLPSDASAVKSAAKLILWTFAPWDLDWLKSTLRGVPLALFGLSVLLLCVVGLAGWALRRNRVAAFAALWVIATLLPVLARPHGWYVYIPSFGACVLISLSASALARRWGRPQLGVLISGALAVAFALTLRQNAAGIRGAGELAASLLRALQVERGTVYLVNAPSVFRGRFPIITSEEQFAAALRLRNAAVTVVPLVFVYLGETDRPRSARLLEDRIECAVETDENSFLTLDGAVLDPPRALRQGQTLAGRSATYRVDRLDSQGKIEQLAIMGFEATVEARPGPIVEYREGRIRALVPGVSRCSEPPQGGPVCAHHHSDPGPHGFGY